MIIISDPHVHNYDRFAKPAIRLKWCLQSIIDAFELAYQNNCHVLCPGDLFDESGVIPTIVNNWMNKVFKAMFEKYPGVMFIVISGNHDHAHDNYFTNPSETALEAFSNNFDHFILIDNSYYITENKIAVWGIPYYKNKECFDKALDQVVEKMYNVKAERHLLMIHQTPEHSNTMIAFETTHHDPRYTLFDKVFCGHIHKPEDLSDRFYIVGSPLHRDLGDEGQQKRMLIYSIISNEVIDYPTNYPTIVRTNETIDNIYAVPVYDEEIPDRPQEHFTLGLSDKHEDIVVKYANYCDLPNKYSETLKALLYDTI